MTGKQSVNESSGVVNVQVIRTHGLMGKVTVNWKSLAVKASHGKDYDGSTGKLIFGENQVVKIKYSFATYRNGVKLR